MTTALAPLESKPEQDPLRLLSITANLLPSEVLDARRAKKLQRGIAAMLVVVVAGLGAWDVHARQQTSSAQKLLTNAQAQTQDLRRQQNTFASLLATKNSAQTITTELQTLMAQDMQWWKLLPTLRATAPAGVTLVNVSGVLNTANGAGSSAASSGIAASAAIGTMSITGLAPDKVRIAAFVQSLTGVSGLGNPFLQSAGVQTGGAFQFTVQVDITAAALGGRYSAANSATTGGH